MRNLQKILALVLALVMSLSLMATAGATDFTDADQIDDLFEESVNVLNGLEVFKGYPTGDFQPQGEITRAEVAAIIYRIATGDVGDTQVGIYADYNKFSDVYASETYSGWAAGYINYCANAEYIKGRGDGKFYPQDKVTGYEALAMILRVVGYDKNGEFTGNDWAVQTAAIANQRGVTDNINAGLLGQAATREMVAEILCKAILLNTVNYTLAYGYQISTNDQDTIAYQTFKMEQVEGVVTGNEIADLENTSPMTAGQTRLVINGEKKTMNFTTGLDDVGMKVRAYLRPQSGTTVKELVSGQTYGQDDLNKVYTTGDKTSVGNSTGSSEGINSIEGAEHFVNYDYATEWTTKIRLTYEVYLRMSDYDAHLLASSNNGGTVYKWNAATDDYEKDASGNRVVVTGAPTSSTDTIIRAADGVYTHLYVKTINAFTALTDTDWDYLRNHIFAKSRYNGVVGRGEVFIGTHDADREDISDDIRWEDFVSAYLEAKENKAQVTSNGLGCTLKIIDNDLDGIAEYVLQTKYTVAKVAANGTGLDIAAIKLTDDDSVNEVSASDKITPVKGLNLEADDEYTPAAGDVVIYAKIDGKVRAQLAENETSRVTSANRGVIPNTVTIESGEKKESWVHTHSNGLASYVQNMVIGTNYTVYFDLYGNVAAFTEGNIGNYVLITDGWFNQAVGGREYAIQAYVNDEALETVNITNNGDMFIKTGTTGLNNSWGMLKDTEFGGHINTGSTKTNDVKTIVALLEGNNLIPVDKGYNVDHNVRMLDMVNNAIPTRSGTGSDANVYATNYDSNRTAYTASEGSAKVFGRSDTKYYYVWQGVENGNPITSSTGTRNYVVKMVTGYSNILNINSMYIEDVYAVGTKNTYNNANIAGATNYTADVVVIELNSSYKYTNTNREQVFIPGTTVVNNESARVAGYGIETVPMIRGNGEYQDNVQVDLNRSSGYNQVDGAQGKIRGGLYYMDPVDTNGNIYTIHKMSPADIRANNYLTGYVAQDTIMEADYVRVVSQMPVYSSIDSSIIGTETSSLGVQGKTVKTENLYTLSYSNGIATLTKAPASTVFDQWKDRGLNNSSPVATNELYDVVTGTFFNNTNSNRNEVLVCGGSSVKWAISFAEKSGNNQNYAQTVWIENLIARDEEVDSNVTFFGVGYTDRSNIADPRFDANGKYITVAYANAIDGQPVIDLSKAYAGTVDTWTLTKWADGSYSVPVKNINAEKIDVDGAKYRLNVKFVTGDTETWYLELIAANVTAALIDTTNGKTATITGNNIKAVDPGLTIREFLDNLDVTNGGRIVEEKCVFWTDAMENIVTSDKYSSTMMSGIGRFELVIANEKGTETTFNGFVIGNADVYVKVKEMKERAADFLTKDELAQTDKMLDEAYANYMKAVATHDNDAKALAEKQLDATRYIVDGIVELMASSALNIHTGGFGATDIQNFLNGLAANRNDGYGNVGNKAPALVANANGDLVDVSDAKYNALGQILSGTMEIQLKSAGDKSDALSAADAVVKTFRWNWALNGSGTDAVGTDADIAAAVKALEVDARDDYAAAYATAGLTTNVNGNTVTISANKTALEKLVPNVLTPESAPAAERDAIRKMQINPAPTPANYNLHAGVTFTAPSLADGVKIRVKNADGTYAAGNAGDNYWVTINKPGTHASGLGFDANGVHDYIPVVKLNATSGEYEVITKSVTLTYEIQFTSSDANLGKVQNFTVTVNAPVAE